MFISKTLVLDSRVGDNLLPRDKGGRCDIQVTTVYLPLVSPGTHLTNLKGRLASWVRCKLTPLGWDLTQTYTAGHASHYTKEMHTGLSEWSLLFLHIFFITWFISLHFFVTDIGLFFSFSSFYFLFSHILFIFIFSFSLFRFTNNFKAKEVCMCVYNLTDIHIKRYTYFCFYLNVFARLLFTGFGSCLHCPVFISTFIKLSLNSWSPCLNHSWV